MRARLMTMPLATGSAPPLSPVPEPRATKGIFSRWHTRTMACTCSVEVGSSTASGSTRNMVRPSHS